MLAGISRERRPLAVVAMVTAGVLAGGCGTPRSVTASTPAAPAAPATTRWNRTVTVTCPQLGSVDVALPSGAATPALPPELVLAIAFQAVDTRTNQAVAGGQSPGAIACGTVPFRDLTASQISPGQPPAGVAPDDRLTGSWMFSATVKIPTP